MDMGMGMGMGMSMNMGMDMDMDMSHSELLYAALITREERENRRGGRVRRK